ncbi:mechanosensitive ion channel protein MscS [Aureimonas sp. Leaf454]|uniref:mechanosensitive ion channel family protein n=1 Tax=Aureimonas sp. Leaf454 TaxID=1736381 RepID=UPI0006F1E0E5|nr:mechanosensitive ion channel family protein [Aureimonas sp. Leaf454]KQT52681.1 mechanosensitive ion channel protein MscS [Aureimonas sp. Leaf454]
MSLSAPSHPLASSGFADTAASGNIVWSFAIVVAFAGIRFAAERYWTPSGDQVEVRQRRFALRASTNAILAICLLGVWLSEIQNLVFSLAAVMVALVVATKELIMCAAGALLRVGGRLFKVGDRIDVLGFCGEVVDHGIFSTTLMELTSAGHGTGGTGRRVTIPNSLLLAGPVRIAAQPRQFAPHRFTVTLEHPVPPVYALSRLDAVAADALSGDMDRASRFHRLSAAKSGVETEGPGAKVHLGTSDIGKMQFHVMLYCLSSDAADLQNRVTAGFLAEVLRANDRNAVASERPEVATRSKVHEAFADLARQLQEPRAKASNAA